MFDQQTPAAVLVVAVALSLVTVAPGFAQSQATSEDGHYDATGMWVPDEEPSTSATPPVGEDLGAYRNHTEMTQRIHELEANNPDLVTVEQVGSSVQDREIWMVTVAEPDRGPHAIEVLFDGGTHGDEVIGAEIVLLALEEIVEGYGSDEELTALVEGNVLRFVPMVNPDGIMHIPDCDYYADCRKNANGVDVNRNFEEGWGGSGSSGDPSSPVYRGPSPLSEPESQAIDGVLEGENTSMHWSLHSGTELILWPWAYTTEDPPEEDVYQEAGQTLQDLTGVRHGQTSEILYLASGSTLDHAYGASGGADPVAFTPEVYGGSGGAFDWWSYFNPPQDQIDDVYQTWRPAIFESIHMADTYTDVRIEAPTVQAPLDTHLRATVSNHGERVFEDGTARVELPDELSTTDGPADVGTLAEGDAASASWALDAEATGTYQALVSAQSPVMGTFRQPVQVDVDPLGARVTSSPDVVGAHETVTVDVEVAALAHEALSADWALTVTGDTATGPYEATLAEGSVAADGEALRVDRTETVEAAGLSDGVYEAQLEVAYEGQRAGQPVEGTLTDTTSWTLERPEVLASKALASPVLPGEPVPVDVAFENVGSLTAQASQIEEAVPAGYVLAPTAGGGLNPYQHVADPAPGSVLVGPDGDTRLSWDVNALAPGESFEASYELIPLAPGTHEHVSWAAYEHAYPDATVDFETTRAVEQTVGPSGGP